ncbi:MAG: hypothetical protein HY308_07560 [Gammaproteobacteria bacterium]|nr:hypothetical protein [Gammaproteobacteria bacterium]
MSTLSADALNTLCACSTVPRDSLRAELDRASGETGFYDGAIATRPHLFSESAVFLSQSHLDGIVALVGAVEAVTALPAYRDAIRQWMPAIATHEFGPLGAFLGYDFHLTSDGPRLIEINTNPGGALLNASLARAHRACCPVLEPYVPSANTQTPEDLFVEMFRNEWRRQRGDARLEHVAIIDESPSSQFLEPEFRLFAHLFAQHGMVAAIVDSRELDWHENRLWYARDPIDLVYNRLTDFALEENENIRDAYLAGSIVLTPHPRAHALYADKRNLTLLSNPAQLRAWGVPAEQVAILQAGIPPTRRVERGDADALWAERRQLFFKPATGYGSKASYRGDKLTRGVWEQILRGEYVAQAQVAPSVRRISSAPDVLLKLDVRAYVYAGHLQLLAARLYQGQTTNFRTPGGGFAPVYVLPDDMPLPDVVSGCPTD